MVRLLTAFAILIAIVGLLSITAIYFSFAAAYALQPLVGSLAYAFLIIGGIYLVFLIIIYYSVNDLSNDHLLDFW